MVELLISVVILGVMSVAVAMNFASLNSMFRFGQEERQYAISYNVANALIDHARSEGKGRLPDPVNFSGYRSAVTNTSINNNPMIDYLIANNVAPELALHDGSASQRVRVYQKFTRTTNIPVEGFGGQTVQIQFDVGAVYHTNCMLGTACMTSGSRPGDSANFQESTFNSWATSGEDGAAVTFSTQHIQASLWRRTHDRLMEARNALADLKTSRMFQADADSVLTENFNPVPSSHSENSSRTDNCWHGWLRLDTATSVLQQVGLSPQLYGLTPWGGQIQYCANYDPSNSGRTTPPYNAALRVHRNVTSGTTPNNTSSNNVYYIF